VPGQRQKVGKVGLHLVPHELWRLATPARPSPPYIAFSTLLTCFASKRWAMRWRPMPRERALFLRLSRSIVAKWVCWLGLIRASICTANYAWVCARGYSCGVPLCLPGGPPVPVPRDPLVPPLAHWVSLVARDGLRDLKLVRRVGNSCGYRTSCCCCWSRLIGVSIGEDVFWGLHRL